MMESRPWPSNKCEVPVSRKKAVYSFSLPAMMLTLTLKLITTFMCVESNTEGDID